MKNKTLRIIVMIFCTSFLMNLMTKKATRMIPTINNKSDDKIDVRNSMKRLSFLFIIIEGKSDYSYRRLNRWRIFVMQLLKTKV